ncbi:hypothetical protein [Corynebacterium sp. HMSC034B08]|uniref:hypothetical protein n=1 Tax=Corynebacterium sp. HMSC034B08 TaxID=1715135 RepID=UPI001FEF118E|nr:hypothetical protein [Corynebacterium sp. HMSC034B08]
MQRSSASPTPDDGKGHVDTAACTMDRFATVHRSMSRDEMLLEYLKTTKTGTYLIPPGVGETGFVGEGMFA